MQATELLNQLKRTPTTVMKNLLLTRQYRGAVRQFLDPEILMHADQAWTREIYWAPFLPRTLSLISVDGFCNLKCRMCGGAQDKLKWLRAQQLETILKHVPTAELITFVAGNSEPLLNPEIAELLRLVKKYGVNANIVSNGHLLKESLIDVMIETGQPSSLNISLDSVDPDIYQNIRGAPLENVLEKLTLFRDKKRAAGLQSNEAPLLSLLMVGMEDNFSGLAAFVTKGHALDAYRVHVDHLNGMHTPGDFTKNPAWKTAAREAISVAETLDLLLQLPHNSIQQLHAAPVAPKTADFQTAAGPASLQERTQHQCPWIDSVYIELDGTLRTCCNTPNPMGNIYHSPLERNTDYLRIRMQNMVGHIHRSCMQNTNCAYVQELKQHKLQPEFIE